MTFTLHTLTGEFTMVRALPVANAPPDWKLPTVPETIPLQGREKWFLRPFVIPRWEAVQTEAYYSQPAKTVAMVHSMSWLSPPTSPYPTLLLVQNLPSQRIDYMQPKSAETKWCHWWKPVKTDISLLSYFLPSAVALLTLWVVSLLGGRQLVDHCCCCQRTLAWRGELIHVDLGCEEGRQQSTNCNQSMY